MPLIKNGAQVEDSWRMVDDDEPLPVVGPVIVSLDRWHSERDALIARGAPLGVRLESAQLAESIAPDLDHLALVAIAFPNFRDGRAYSTARLLRERHGFDGEVRAVGEVLRDQFLFMLRCGFDAFEVRDGTMLEDWLRAVSEITVWYQPTGDARTALPALRHRRAAAE